VKPATRRVMTMASLVLAGETIYNLPYNLPYDLPYALPHPF